MFIPASSEFVALCQSQVAVLTQGLGAALSAVYLTTEELVEGTQPKLIPVVVYPDAAKAWDEDDSDRVLPEQIDNIDTIPRLSKAIPRLLPQLSDYDSDVDSTAPEWGDNSLYRQRQIVLPLIHEGVVMGLLVTSREDRPWNEREQATIERIARTLTIAYIVDRRRVWSEQQLTQTRALRSQQRDVLDNLLHQFRNPLTALRTLGKLLVKRLLDDEKNRDVASSIVRESDRLQELLQEFDECLNMTQSDIEPFALPPELVSQTSPVPLQHRERVPTTDRGQPLKDHPSNQLETTQGRFPLLPGKALTLESFSIADVLEPLLLSATAIAQERDLKLLFSIPNNLPPVRGHARALREVLNNLIDNALKYTPTGGQIDIQVSVQQRTSDTEMMAIAISDTGPGITPQDLDHLFERHYRGIQATTGIPGSGLGLAIAKELIQQMQGEIDVLSPAQPVWTQQNSELGIGTVQDRSARGTTFIVWLLLAAYIG